MSIENRAEESSTEVIHSELSPLKIHLTTVEYHTFCLITARIRMMGEVLILFQFRPGVGRVSDLHPILLPLVQCTFLGIPHRLVPGPFQGCPSPRHEVPLSWGTPSQHRMWYPTTRTGWGTPWAGDAKGSRHLAVFHSRTVLFTNDVLCFQSYLVFCVR